MTCRVHVVLWTASILSAVILVGCTGASATTAPATTSSKDRSAARIIATPPPPRPVDDRVLFSKSGWKTDFQRRTVPLSEITSGGPPRDGIPPIDQPKFIPASDATAWLKDNEPVVLLEVGDHVRAYPLQILIWHEIVNDSLGETPVAVTFCPLCNTAIAFDRRVDAAGTLRFGTTGNLRHSDLVMWSNDVGETWWQQITGEAIVGALAGTRLVPLPAQIVAFGDFKHAHPAGLVLGRETGHFRQYGSNPYVGYDDVQSSPFLFSGQKDSRLPPMERVVAVDVNGEMAAYPFRELLRVRVANDVVGGVPIVVLHQGGTASPLDASAIPASRDIGAAGAFERTLEEGQVLTFREAAGAFSDLETSSTWDITGRATTGPLIGRRLQPIVHDNRFWFVAAVVRPDVRLWSP